MIKELEQLGLTTYEARIFFELTKSRFSLRELSKKARVPFGKVYSIVKLLKQKNLIQETNTRPKVVFIKNISESISLLINKNKQESMKTYETLKLDAIKLDKQNKNPSKFFEIAISENDREKLQLRIFKEAQNEVLQIFNIFHNPLGNRKRKSLYEREISKAVKRGVEFRAIYPKDVRLPKIIEQLRKNKKFEIFNKDTNFQRCDISDSKNVLIKFTSEDEENRLSIFIEDEKLAEFLIKTFHGISFSVEE